MKDPLSITHPQIAVQWHPTKNGNLTPEQVVAGSGKKAWWICTKFSSHEWEAVINSRVRGNGCPCCASQKLSSTNSLVSRCPKLAQEWHPIKNGALTPEQVIAGSHKNVWWICSKVQTMNGEHLLTIGEKDRDVLFAQIKRFQLLIL